MRIKLQLVDMMLPKCSKVMAVVEAGTYEPQLVCVGGLHLCSGLGVVHWMVRLVAGPGRAGGW